MESAHTIHILVLGVMIVLVLLLRPALDHIGVPPLVGYFVLGFALRLADAQWSLLDATGHEIFAFLGSVGIVVLLFRVGLESDLPGLVERLPPASLVWGSNVAISGGAGYGAAAYGLGWPLVPSLFVGVALTATSVGVAVALWDEANLLKTDDGELMLDVAELDDVSGVVLMGVLFTLTPVFHANPAASLIPLAAQTLGGFALKFAAFTAGCIAVSLYVEEPLTAFFEQIQRWPGTIMVVLGIGMVVAAIASLLGFSLAIGAFFAGLIFSRDPKAVKMETSFNAFYPLFAAFFFIDIGRRIDPTALESALGPALVLLAAAVLGKGLGVLLPALALTRSSGALLLSLSLVPRAEIMLIIMQRGLDLGPWAVPPELFAQMVLVSAATMLLVPPLVRPLFSHLSSPPNPL